jgi:hypothetical protein
MRAAWHFHHVHHPWTLSDESMRRVERFYFIALCVLTILAAVGVGYAIARVTSPGAFGENDLASNMPLAMFMLFMMLAIAPGGLMLIVLLAVLPVWLWSRTRAPSNDEIETPRSERRDGMTPHAQQLV